MKKIWRTLCLLLVLTLSVPAIEATVPDIAAVQSAEAAAITNYYLSNITIKYGQQGQIKVPSDYKKPTFASSNKKVVTVSKNGVIKAVRLGTAKITAKYKGRTKIYTVTVTPKKKTDLQLNCQAVFCGETKQLKLVSDKYDTSQIQLKTVASAEVGSNGKAKLTKVSEGYAGILEVWFGSYYLSFPFYRVPDELQMNRENYVFANSFEYLNSNQGFGKAGADNERYYVETDLLTLSHDFCTTAERETLLNFIEAAVDGKTWDNPYDSEIQLTPGVHTLSLKVGGKTVEWEVTVMASPENAVKTGNTTGYPKKDALVIEKMHEVITNPDIINENMSDREKVKAIHDYLIYHSNYDKDYLDTGVISDEAASTYGVLIEEDGVCNAYAAAFQAFMAVLDIPCTRVTGRAGSDGDMGGHAWNRVQIDGVWYYIDCTWDDPIDPSGNGGHENHGYFLSETLWQDHIADRESTVTNDIGSWYHLWLFLMVD